MTYLNDDLNYSV